MGSLSYPTQQLFDSVVSSFDVVDHYPPHIAAALISGDEVRPAEVNGVVQTARQSLRLIHEENPEGLQEALRLIGEPCALRIRAILDAVRTHEVTVVA
ncbi:hypothetical protein AUJ46_06290 [Candidatus Peregrinibacteria bacterium CG1_02_54_53]|nr:MAG: hypothetical protein AUJ46_06290 [Candidatus Peregrinibacteria bacterium CG1_02_54_53]